MSPRAIAVAALILASSACAEASAAHVRRIGADRMGAGAARPFPWSAKDPTGFKLVTDRDFFHWERPWHRTTEDGEEEYGGTLGIHMWESDHVCYHTQAMAGKPVKGSHLGKDTYRGRCALSPAAARPRADDPLVLKQGAEFFILDYMGHGRAPWDRIGGRPNGLYISLHYSFNTEEGRRAGLKGFEETIRSLRPEAPPEVKKPSPTAEPFPPLGEGGAVPLLR